ncbi:MAG: hypothetical protein P1U64_04640 [Alcanivoracaceae bacterium]|nr:hypothetical protein [Alcanivoracaceae bacterium]
MRRLTLQLAVLLVSALAGLPASALAQVLKIEASALDALIGKPVASYSFFAQRDGRFDPVPHQWMEFTRDGLPWFASDSTTENSGTTTTIDSTDRLLLRREDGGDKLAGRVSETVVGELAVSVAGETRYFYVVANAYRQATQRYVKFDREKMVVKSTNYALSMDPENMLIWNDFYYRGYQGSSGARESILDTLKIRLSAGVFSENTRITMNNSNLEPRIEEIVEGPLAWGVFATTTLHVARIPVMKIRNYFLLQPKQVDIHSRFTLPLVAKTVLQRPDISISMDGNQLYGGKLVTSWTGSKVALTDGKMSADEEAMVGNAMQGRNWLWFSTDRGFDLLAMLDFRSGFEQPARLLYQDDATLSNEPERFPGQLPNVGFTIEDIPIGKEFYFLASLFFSGNSDGLPPGRYAASTLDEPVVSFTSSN